ncbi:MAG: DNA replication and repair protein RecF [Rikenellaceae bacterium]|nr:DNA replication and repair protein RecF [Rikenellaceae bacterium]
MYLKKITVNNFKNIPEAQIIFSPKINCITGINGSGKTNLMDAVYYLSMTKSFFSTVDHLSIMYDSDCTSLNGEYARDDSGVENISLSFNSKGEKYLKRNSRNYTRFSDHIGLIPVVMVSPSDTSLINESGDERRKFMNAILSQIDKEYLRRLQNYNQILIQRNRLLKGDMIPDELLSTFNEQLSVNASYIYRMRGDFIERLVPLVKEYYNLLSGEREDVDIEYKSDLHEESLDEILVRNLDKDRYLGYTSSGIQRDDLVFCMKGHPIKRGGSQGQQKSFLIALKLAQFAVMKKLHGVSPILLLDDLFDKLDMFRVEQLLRLVSSDFFGQIFITDSNKVRISNILDEIDGESLSFEIDNGVIR